MRQSRRDPAADDIAACCAAKRPAGCVVLIADGVRGVARRAPGGPPNGRARREAGPAAARSADALISCSARPAARRPTASRTLPLLSLLLSPRPTRRIPRAHSGLDLGGATWT